MTILDATSLLFNWFKDNDSFELSKDFSKLVLVTDSPQRDKAAVVLALENLRESEVLREKELDEANYWVLNKPFETYEQTVTISPILAGSIAKIVNDYCEYLEDQTEAVDPTNINEKDIQNMLYICTKFLENNS